MLLYQSREIILIWSIGIWLCLQHLIYGWVSFCLFTRCDIWLGVILPVCKMWYMTGCHSTCWQDLICDCVSFYLFARCDIWLGVILPVCKTWYMTECHSACLQDVIYGWVSFYLFARSDIWLWLSGLATCLPDLLGIPAGPNNGTDGSLYHLLREPPPVPPPPVADPVTQYGDCDFPPQDQYDDRANLTVSGCVCDIQVGYIVIEYWI